MAAPETVTGRCACGTVRYRAGGPFRPVIACHCETCRRQSGHFVAATQVSSGKLEITDGTANVRWWHATAEARRGFCDTCGSLLFWEPAGGSETSIFAGSLDAPTGLRLIEHIYACEKGDYYEIADGLPVSEKR